MSILKVARIGNPVLRAIARLVEPSEIQHRGFQRFVDDMIETMNEYRGIGLAAPQVHESVRFIVVGIQDDDEDEASVEIVPLVNPEITALGSELVEGWEGCLSIPEMRGRVPRAAKIRLQALDRRGKWIDRTLEGFAARVVQHEADHLDGVLFIDRMRSLDTLTHLDEYARFWAKDQAVSPEP
jgi:peptide deformylase